MIVTATVGPDTVGNLDNAATVTATTSDPEPSKNGATTRTVITRSADVSVDKRFTGVTAVPGTDVSWTASVRNAGPSTATAVVLTDTVPDAVTGVTATFGRRRRRAP